MSCHQSAGVIICESRSLHCPVIVTAAYRERQRELMKISRAVKLRAFELSDPQERCSRLGTFRIPSSSAIRDTTEFIGESSGSKGSRTAAFSNVYSNCTIVYAFDHHCPQIEVAYDTVNDISRGSDRHKILGNFPSEAFVAPRKDAESQAITLQGQDKLCFRF